MAAPVIAASGALVSYSGAASLAVPVPAGVVSGSVLVAHVCFAWNQTTTNPTNAAITPPTGWTFAYGAAFTDVSDGYVMYNGWYYKTASASDTGTYSFAGGTVGTKAALGLAGRAYLITGSAAVPLGDTLHASAAASATSTVTLPTFTPAQDNSLLIGFDCSFSNVSAAAQPTGWTLIGTGSGSGAGGELDAYLSQTTTTATGSTVWKVTAGDNNWVTVATVMPPSTDATVTPPAGTMTMDGQAPTVSTTGDATVTPPAGAISLAGQAPTVTGSTAPAITTSSLGTVRQGTAFDLTIAATGSPTSWAVITGSLPAGLSLNTATGEISGTPTGGALTYSFTLQATNGSGPGSQSYSGNVLLASETSRTTGATSGSTAYTKVVGTLGSDGWVGYFPSASTTGIKAMIWNHPYQSPYDNDIAGTGDSGWTFTLTSWLLDNGISIVSSNDAGDQFGNAAVMTAIDSLYAAVNNFFGIGKLIVYGESMGCAATLNWTARHNTAPLVGAMTISGVCDTSLFSAYFTYSAAYNPMLTTASSWAGLPIFMESSAADGTVSETSNTNAFITHLGGAATVTKVEGTGDHLTSGNYPVSSMESWITSVMAGTNATVTPPAGAVALTGQAPTVTADATVTASAGTLTLDGQVPTIAADASVAAATGTVTLDGQSPTVSTSSSGDATVTAPVGSIAVAGQAPAISATQSATVQAGVGSIAIVGRTPQVGQPTDEPTYVITSVRETTRRITAVETVRQVVTHETTRRITIKESA